MYVNVCRFEKSEDSVLNSDAAVSAEANSARSKVTYEEDIRGNMEKEIQSLLALHKRSFT